MARAPGFFKGAPLVVDFEEVGNDVTQDHVSAVCAVVIEAGLVPVGITNIKGAAAKSIQSVPALSCTSAPSSASLEWKDAEGGPPKPIEGKQENKTETQSQVTGEASAGSALSPGATTLMIPHSIRTGQQVYAKGGNLCIMGSVSSGAEVVHLTLNLILIRFVLHNKPCTNLTWHRDVLSVTGSCGWRYPCVWYVEGSRYGG